MTADPRLADAREFLAGARRRKIGELPPSVLARLAAELRRQLGQVIDVIDEGAEDDGLEPYCTVCLSWVGMFVGLAGWHHFRGDPAPGGQRVLYDAGHEAAVGWIAPPGRELSPADMAGIRSALEWKATIRQALIEATRWREERPGDATTADQIALYATVARALGVDLDLGGAS